MHAEDNVRIQHMIDAAESAMRFTQGRGRADLDTDEMLRFALTHAIEIVGEAASKVSVETRSALPQIPWAAVAGMRNRLAHAYFDVNPDILWRTAQQDIPELLAQLKAISFAE